MKLTIVSNILCFTRLHKKIKTLVICLLLALFTIATTIILIISLDLIIDDPGLLTRDDLPFVSFDLFATCSSMEQKDSIEKLTVTQGIPAQPCIFNPFIDLFHKNNSAYRYFPSYFVNSQFDLLVLVPHVEQESNPVLNKTALMGIDNYGRYFTLEYRNDKYYNLVSDLYNIVSEYIRTSKSK
jgi:hypothetical protein